MATSTSSVPARTSSRSRRIASLSIGGRPLEPEEQIRAARLEARQVDRDVEVPELAEARDDRLPSTVFPEAPDLVEGELEAGQPVVVADAELPEAERADEFFGGVHTAQLVGRDPIAVLEPRRETRERRLVPGRQRERARELPDLRLAE